MSPDKTFGRHPSIQELLGGRNMSDLVNALWSERDAAVAGARDRLFSALKSRDLPEGQVYSLWKLASLSYQLHRPESRITGGPYIVHPFEVAATIASCPFSPPAELVEDVTVALCHDLLENTLISKEQMAQFIDASTLSRVELMSNRIKAQGGPKLNREEYIKRIADQGSVRDWRIKIADWNHNLATTPRSTEGFPQDQHIRIAKLQRKFPDTSPLILPLVRKLPSFTEQEYWYGMLKTTYDQHKFEGAPDLEPLEPAA